MLRTTPWVGGDSPDLVGLYVNETSLAGASELCGGSKLEAGPSVEGDSVVERAALRIDKAGTISALDLAGSSGSWLVLLASSEISGIDVDVDALLEACSVAEATLELEVVGKISDSAVGVLVAVGLSGFDDGAAEVVGGDDGAVMVASTEAS